MVVTVITAAKCQKLLIICLSYIAGFDLSTVSHATFMSYYWTIDIKLSSVQMT